MQLCFKLKRNPFIRVNDPLKHNAILSSICFAFPTNILTSTKVNKYIWDTTFANNKLVYPHTNMNIYILTHINTNTYTQHATSLSPNFISFFILALVEENVEE